MKLFINFVEWEKFMPKLYLRHAGFTYTTCTPFNKHWEMIQKFKKTSNLNYIRGN